MINFRKDLNDYLITWLTPVVGIGSDPTNFIKTFDKKLQDFPITGLPALVVNVRTAEKAAFGGGGSEIGQKDLRMWTTHIYYIDAGIDNWDTGDDKRNVILAKIDKFLQSNRTLGGFSSTDSDNTREYVYASDITAALFDSSGQTGDYSFVSELYLNIYSAVS